MVAERRYVETIMFMMERHEGQTRIGGRPYLVHPLAVGLLVSSLTDDMDVIEAAFLHDILEDTITTEMELRDIFGGRVADLVKEVTNEVKLEVKDGRVDFYIQKMSKMTPDALLIKLADRLNNVSDLNRAKDPFKTAYKQETLDILAGIKPLLASSSWMHQHLALKIYEQLEKVK